jgi:hypothetical protein
MEKGLPIAVLNKMRYTPLATDALCPMPYALCPMPARAPHVTEKGSITFVQSRIKHGSALFLVGFRLDRQHLARGCKEISNKEFLTSRKSLRTHV